MKRLIIAALICLASASAASAQTDARPAPPPPADPHAGHGAMQHDPQQESAAQKYFTDVELTDQDGRKVRFYSDVLKGKTVVVNAFFTTCTSVCPPMNRNMEKIQEVFGDRVGREVFFVSITVDPAVDT